MRLPSDRNGPATRQEIINTLRHEPGLTKSRLARQLQVSLGTISYHVRLLEAERAVVRRKVGARQRWFLANVSDQMIECLDLAHRPLLPEILTRVSDDPGVGIQVLANTFHVDRRVIRRHLDALIESGLVAQTRHYRPRFYVIEQTRANKLVACARRGLRTEGPGPSTDVRSGTLWPNRDGTLPGGTVPHDAEALPANRR